MCYFFFSLHNILLSTDAWDWIFKGVSSQHMGVQRKGKWVLRRSWFKTTAQNQEGMPFFQSVHISEEGLHRLEETLPSLVCIDPTEPY